MQPVHGWQALGAAPVIACLKCEACFTLMVSALLYSGVTEMDLPYPKEGFRKTVGRAELHGRS